MTGGCLCGGVRYQVEGEVFAPRYCHCSLCRRWTGADAAAGVSVLGEQVRVRDDARLLRTFRWEDRKEFVFCSRCGSNLFTTARWPPESGARLNIRLGSADGDPGVRPGFRIDVGSKAPWADISDDLPRFEAPAG